MNPTCDFCDVPISDEVARMTRRLLAALDAERMGAIETVYERRPEVLCAACFNPMLAEANRAAADARTGVRWAHDAEQAA